jgi:hypothetical protein
LGHGEGDFIGMGGQEFNDLIRPRAGPINQQDFFLHFHRSVKWPLLLKNFIAGDFSD